MSRVARDDLLLVAILFLLAAGPRILALDRFATTDERKWLARSGNFLQALSTGQFELTFQREHPGVTTMWLGLLGFRTVFPDYTHYSPPQFGWKVEEIEPWLRAHGREPIDLLAGGRRFVALVTALAVALCYPFLRRLFGDAPLAFAATALIALDPFYLGLSRLLHVDALVTGFATLSLLAFMVWLWRGRSRSVLVLSGVAAGLAWLTKSPALFLGPFLGLAAFAAAWRDGRSAGSRWTRVWRGAVVPMVGWTAVGAAVFVLLWPAMWVDPLGSLRGIVVAAEDYATEGHVNANFFLGRVVAEDPGLAFYPVALLWRLTPVVVVGVALLLPALAWVRRERPDWAAPLAGLALWTLAFVAFMSVGAKKFDRYVLPVHPALTIIAAAGLCSALRLAGLRLRRQTVPGASDRGERRPWLSGAGLALAVGAQALMALPLAPYYIDFYSPLLGGARVAQRQIFFGWGEGLDEAARYLNARPDAANLRVAASYADGPFDYFFSGHARVLAMSASMDNLLAWLSTDYIVIYINQVQRRLPAPEVVDYLETIEPEYVVERQGVPYAWVYRTGGAEPPPFLETQRFRQADFGGVIRLLATSLQREVLEPGEILDLTVYLQALAPMDRNYSVSVRLVGADGERVAQDDGWPWGFPTSRWAVRDVLPDGHQIPLPAGLAPGVYQIQFVIYDPETLAPLPVTQDGQPAGDTVVLEYVRVEARGAARPAPAVPLDASVGGELTLAGADLPAPVAPGAPLELALYWSVARRPSGDYQRFVHLLGPDGTIVAQRDSQPLDGFYPTSFWDPGETVRDPVRIPVPAGTPAGTYRLRAGLYTRDGVRLSVSGAAAATADAVDLGTVEVSP